MPFWSNPLSTIPLISPHPTFSPEDSPLSSAAASPGQYGDLREKSRQILEDYTPINDVDDTTKVLSAFLENLPKNGQMMLMGEIQLYESEPVKLRRLRNFLVDAILKPISWPFERSADFTVACR
ncbi:hypothetical protein VTI74DRAFT_179 [Chaetomium olivicolor]